MDLKTKILSISKASIERSVNQAAPCYFCTVRVAACKFLLIQMFQCLSATEKTIASLKEFHASTTHTEQRHRMVRRNFRFRTAGLS
jgi:hypothetical protein